VKMCVAREFAAWATGRTAPVIPWLRALAGNLHDTAGGPGVGAVGMCFSGGFALGMMVDDRMLAPVLSQPSLPVAIGKRRGANLHLSDDDLARVVERAGEGCQVMGLRFTDDGLVGTRFDTLRSVLGDAFLAVELPSSAKRDHSVLTEQRDDASVQRVIQFFVERLQR
jgi:dienelactone hydrolase